MWAILFALLLFFADEWWTVHIYLSYDGDGGYNGDGVFNRM